MPMYLIDSEDGPFVLLADEDYINDYYPDAQLLDAYEAEAYEEPEHVQVITRRQGLLAIYRQKHVTEENIQAIIDQMPDEDARYEAHVEFHSAFWELDNPMVAMFAQHLGISDEELQQLFDYAGGL